MTSKFYLLELEGGKNFWIPESVQFEMAAALEAGLTFELWSRYKDYLELFNGASNMEPSDKLIDFMKRYAVKSIERNIKKSK